MCKDGPSSERVNNWSYFKSILSAVQHFEITLIGNEMCLNIKICISLVSN